MDKGCTYIIRLPLKTITLFHDYIIIRMLSNGLSCTLRVSFTRANYEIGFSVESASK
jgi:hypothetical protein